MSLFGWPEFFVGANLPWLHYGIDFGANAWRLKGGVAEPDQRSELAGQAPGVGREGEDGPARERRELDQRQMRQAQRM